MGKKRDLDEKSTQRTTKKIKLDKNKDNSQKSTVQADDVDFPRGGGTTFTPLEVKTLRAEAAKEADKELFGKPQLGKKRNRKYELKTGGHASSKKSDKIRIEYLNYKRLCIGMKILGQIFSVQPLALIVSLPNQLLAHVPITNVSPQLTSSLEAMELDDDPREEDEGEDAESTSGPQAHAPDLLELFRPGEYVRAVVTAVHEPGTTGIAKTRDPVWNASRRVELSLVPDKVNEGVQKTDLRKGFTLTASVKSLEDHGYILDLGISGVSGFLSFKDAREGPFLHHLKLPPGKILDVTVTAMLSNGRTCNVSVDPALYASSSLHEIANVSSILPGTLVQSLVTAAHPTGLNLQILGYFEGTIDQFHSSTDASSCTVGKKLKARVLYSHGASPPRFVLSLKDHIIGLDTKYVHKDNASISSDIQVAYPVGTILESVKVLRTEPERGLIVSVQPGLEGFVHVSQTSDDHVASLPSNSGPWKTGSVHRARVTGYFLFDGLLELSMRQSIMERKFMQVEDVRVGEMMIGTVKKLTESGLFLSLSGSIDGVIWPNHYADILLKHPAKRFKSGKSIKCRVLVVDPERSRIALTAKKTLLQSDLPVLSTLEDVKVGIVAHAVVFKVLEKNLMVEFYNNLKAIVPFREASETPVDRLADSFAIGKVVKVRIISIDTETPRIVASIKQASPNFQPTITDISGVEIGNIVEGTVIDVHKDNAVLTLDPTQARALISLKNLANHRSTSLAQLRTSLKEGTKLEGLIVVQRNPEKGIVIVANSPKVKPSLPSKSSISMDNVAIGQIVGGRVTRHSGSNALVKINAHIGGVLHPTNLSDDYDMAPALPSVDSVIRAVILAIDKSKNQLVLSTRHSRMYPNNHKPVVDQEVSDVAELHVGQTLRGYIKSIVDHGLFVSLAPEIDARVQIKELFDDYVKDWKPCFQNGQIVKGRILSVDIENKKIEMTFCSESRRQNKSAVLTLSDLHEGQVVNSRVKKVEEYGLFLEIEGSKLSGLCHKSELSDNQQADLASALRSFREGDQVRAIILTLDTEKRRISLGLKPSYFADDNQEYGGTQLDAMSNDLDGNSPEAVNDSTHEHGSVDSVRDQAESDEDTVHINLDVRSIPFEPVPSPAPSKQKEHAPLKIPGGFQWSANDMQRDDHSESESSPDDADADAQSSKKKKRRRKEIEHDLTADLHTKPPESNVDFERLLLGSPNSSYLWIQYMSFQLQLSEVEKARQIARRAIQTINFREDQERMNVWIALLNLENAYGTDETIESTFKDAARCNDSKTIHLRLASILDQADKHEKAEEQYKRTCKKFGQSSKVWTLFGEHYFARGKPEEARKLLPRSLQSLEKRKHLKTISKFAQLEYRIGDAERGKTIFEGIVDSHPKRWDLWSIYMDMEAGQGNMDSLRHLFDRLFTLKMTSHKAKTFFKKWLALEKKLGDEEGATNVKQKAIEWTQKAAS